MTWCEAPTLIQTLVAARPAHQLDIRGPVSAILVWNKIFKEEEESVEGGGAHTPDIYLHFGRDKQTNGQMHQQMITIYTRETDTQMSNRQQERERIEPTGKAYL